MTKTSSWHVGIAAEAVAAAQFARCGFDVSVQYGANQPEYDLVVVRARKFLRVSVKGSQSGSWGLTQKYLQNADYQRAADLWLKSQRPDTVFCLVQFKDVSLDQLPRVYLATPREITNRLRKSAGGRGATILYEERRWGPRAHGTGTIDRIPESWRFSHKRVLMLLKSVRDAGNHAAVTTRPNASSLTPA